VQVHTQLDELCAVNRANGGASLLLNDEFSKLWVERVHFITKHASLLLIGGPCCSDTFLLPGMI
jgi:hypothetical protein